MTKEKETVLKKSRDREAELRKFMDSNKMQERLKELSHTSQFIWKRENGRYFVKKWERRCSALNCHNKRTGHVEADGAPVVRQYYKFPVKDPDRCTEWLENVRRNDLLKLGPCDTLKNNYWICGDHFEARYLMCPTKPLTNLTWNAVPTVFDFDECKMEARFGRNRMKYAARELLAEAPKRKLVRNEKPLPEKRRRKRPRRFRSGSSEGGSSTSEEGATVEYEAVRREFRGNHHNYTAYDPHEVALRKARIMQHSALRHDHGYGVLDAALLTQRYRQLVEQHQDCGDTLRKVIRELQEAKVDLAKISDINAKLVDQNAEVLKALEQHRILMDVKPVLPSKVHLRPLQVVNLKPEEDGRGSLVPVESVMDRSYGRERKPVMKVRGTQYRPRDVYTDNPAFSDDDVHEVGARDEGGAVDPEERKRIRIAEKNRRRKMARQRLRLEAVTVAVGGTAAAVVEPVATTLDRARERAERRRERRRELKEERKKRRRRRLGTGSLSTSDLQLRNPDKRWLDAILESEDLISSPVKLDHSLYDDDDIGGNGDEEGGDVSELEQEEPVPVEEMSGDRMGSVKFVVGEKEIHLPKIEWVVKTEVVASSSSSATTTTTTT